MKIFVSGATRTVASLISEWWSDHLGCLRVPGETPNTVPEGVDWGMDNGCYKGVNAKGINRLLWHCYQSEQGKDPCHFVTVPDVVGNWGETLEFFLMFREGCMEKYGYIPWTLAIVLQEGVSQYEDLWFADAIFVGGKDHDFKLKYCEPILQKAKADGKWVHMGRINGLKKIKYLHDMGCVDSFDGSGYSRFPGIYLKPAMQLMRQLKNRKHEQGLLFE